MSKQEYEIGQTVQKEEGGEWLPIREYAKGWYTLSDGTKARGKDLTALEDEPEEDEEGTRSMAKTLSKYREKYTTGVTAEGRKSLNNGDDIAELLEGMDAMAVMKMAEQLCGLEAGELVAKYEHLNNGAKRMNAGNRIRAFAKRENLSVEEVSRFS